MWKCDRRVLWLVPLALALGLAVPRAPQAETATYQYRYDSAGRLTEVSSATLVRYTYDAAGTVTVRESGPNPVLFADGFEGAP
jgi:hypothetical protein